MLLEYTGPNRRTVGEHTWSPDARVVDVTDVELIQVLLTTPGGRMRIADDDPLAAIVGRDAAGALALEGVIDPDGLAAADLEVIASATDVSSRSARAWQRAAGNDSNDGGED